MFINIFQSTPKYDAELKALETQITPQQKQQAIQKFQEYVNSTGKQDIEGFKSLLLNLPLLKKSKNRQKMQRKDSH